MRSLLVLPALALAACSFAQRTAAESTIQDALTTLQSSTSVFMRLNGSETIGSNKVLIDYDTYFQFSVLPGGRTLAQVAVIGYKNGVEINRLIGDGVTLWKYDDVKNTYSATLYGKYSGVQPDSYEGDLFKALGSQQDGYSAYPILTLIQTFNPGGVNYQTWMPGYPATSGASPYIVTYSAGNPIYRQISFNMGTNDSGSTVLGSIDYWDAHTVGSRVKTTQWSITVTPDWSFSPSVFKFTAPAGARSISQSRPVSG